MKKDNQSNQEMAFDSSKLQSFFMSTFSTNNMLSQYENSLTVTSKNEEIFYEDSMDYMKDSSPIHLIADIKKDQEWSNVLQFQISREINDQKIEEYKKLFKQFPLLNNFLQNIQIPLIVKTRDRSGKIEQKMNTKKEKNKNMPKFLGKIFIQQIERYSSLFVLEGLDDFFEKLKIHCQMLKKLYFSLLKEQTQKKSKPYFSKYHLQDLLAITDLQCPENIRKMASFLCCKALSLMISDPKIMNKVIFGKQVKQVKSYLMTLKVFRLRCCSRKLLRCQIK